MCGNASDNGNTGIGSTDKGIKSDIGAPEPSNITDNLVSGGLPPLLTPIGDGLSPLAAGNDGLVSARDGFMPMNGGTPLVNNGTPLMKKGLTALSDGKPPVCSRTADLPLINDYKTAAHGGIATADATGLNEGEKITDETNATSGKKCYLTVTY